VEALPPGALLASGLDPDEVMCFDSPYGDEVPGLVAESRIASPGAAQSCARVLHALWPEAWPFCERYQLVRGRTTNE
jgi:hypothetical protein